MFLHRLLALAALLFMSVPGLNQQAPDPQDAIARLRSEWSKNLHDKKLDQIVMLYAEEAAFLPPNGDRITGRTEIRKLTKAAMDTFTSDLTFQSMNFEHSGDLAYDSGEYRETLTNISDGGVSHGQGNYLMVLKRQPDGTWLIVQQAWTSFALAHP